MNRLTEKECYSLREAYYSIYNQEIAEKLGYETAKNIVKTQLPKVGDYLKNAGKSTLTSMTPAAQRIAQGVKDEAGRLGNRVLFDTIPAAYRGTKEAIKTVGSYPANGFRYILGDKGLLRNKLVQAGATGLAIDNAVRGKNSFIAPVINAINKYSNPNLRTNNYQMDDDKFIIECLNLIANHLIEEKYASNEKAALKIIENMSEGWTHNILQNYLEE